MSKVALHAQSLDQANLIKLFYHECLPKISKWKKKYAKDYPFLSLKT